MAVPSYVAVPRPARRRQWERQNRWTNNHNLLVAITYKKSLYPQHFHRSIIIPLYIHTYVCMDNYSLMPLYDEMWLTRKILRYDSTKEQICVWRYRNVHTFQYMLLDNSSNRRPQKTKIHGISSGCHERLPGDGYFCWYLLVVHVKGCWRESRPQAVDDNAINTKGRGYWTVVCCC